MKILFALLLFCITPVCLMPSAAFACTVTSDCEAGSRCVKPDGGLYGVCRGGFSPGNANDKRPISSFSGIYGDTCRFDIDCGVHGKCKKRRSGVLGTCVGS
jgi:hypothetical protein